MRLSSQSFADGAHIPSKFAFCMPDPKSHVTLSQNLNPHLAWEDLPARTASLAIICADPDAPSIGTDVNQEGHRVAVDLPRAEFIHWVLYNLPATLQSIAAGEFSSEVVPRGKPRATAPHGASRGINDYTDWFSNDKDMNGEYYGYDGPCPPWNDDRVHRYVFTLYALDVPSLSEISPPTAASLREAMAGHILATASLTGLYTLNPELL
jgi:Raf kinase inhibitor-like YbhB/YbcL family protein